MLNFKISENLAIARSLLILFSPSAGSSAICVESDTVVYDTYDCLLWGAGENF